MTMRIDFAKFAIPHDATNDELRDWINELYAMWANTSDLLAEYQEDEYVKVVRCRDCKFYYPKEGAMLSCKFEYHNFTQWRLAKPDGFCAWAVKRKEGGDD